MAVVVRQLITTGVEVTTLFRDVVWVVPVVLTGTALGAREEPLGPIYETIIITEAVDHLIVVQALILVANLS